MTQFQAMLKEQLGDNQWTALGVGGILFLLIGAVLVKLLFRVPLKYNLRSLRARWVTSLMTVFGAALVVWASVLAFGLAAGLDHTLDVSGDPLDLVILRKGATSETSSIIEEPRAKEIALLAGVAHDENAVPLYSPELVVVVNKSRRANAGNTNLIIRGVTPMAKRLRTAFHIVEGREPTPGKLEVMTSRSIAARFEGAGLNETIEIWDQKFRIVGLFEAGGTAAESEVWTDLAILAQESKRPAVLSSVQVRAASPNAMKALKRKLAEDEQFGFKAVTETEYYDEQRIAGLAIKIVGQLISFFLTLGAMFAVANTMFGAVASRGREIGTLRSLGFSKTDILVSFLLESMLLCLAGGLIGCLAARALNGLSTGTANWQTFSEITFSFQFGPMVLLQGVALALGMGLVGGLLPAIRSSQMKIVDALREI